MRKLFYLTVLGSSMLLYSCGGGSETATEETTSEVMEATDAEEKTHEINVLGSKVNWEGNMLGMYNHTGTIALKEGTLTTKGDQVTGGSFVVDMSKMEATDDNYTEQNTPAKLIGHLSSPDFFDVENHPTAKFEITKVDGNKVMGNLTIRGNTNEETIENVKIAKQGEQTEITGKLTFDRQKYDVSFKHPVEENVIADEIELDINLLTM